MHCDGRDMLRRRLQQLELPVPGLILQFRLECHLDGIIPIDYERQFAGWK